ISSIFGSPHPIKVNPGNDYLADAFYDTSTKKTAIQQYLKFRNFDTTIPAIPCSDFAYDLGRVKTANCYAYSWKAEYKIEGEGAGTRSEEGNALSSAKYLDLKGKVGTVVESDASHTVTLTSVTVTAKTGPVTGYSDYMVVDKVTKREFQLNNVVNFFMKYVEEYMLELPPDATKSDSYCYPEDEETVPGMPQTFSGYVSF
ncbi:MAG: hypothetical protein HQM10_23710, partial [Candidatus Riflebacteria bacterium]|nr:hypothetical protein [Candidatus Riflebacteria bacterium]